MSAWQVCADCGTRLRTLDNIREFQVADADTLTPTHAPVGGCQCPNGYDPSFQDCRACYPPELRCRNHPLELHGNLSIAGPHGAKLKLARTR